MILFLPPAPHTGAFFDEVRAQLSGIETAAATYPGYGNEPAVTDPSIEGYASALLPIAEHTHLAGFHTGCLVALEMATQQEHIGSITLVDVPYFDAATKAKHRKNLDPANPKHAAFFAAFNYTLDDALQLCTRTVNVIATNSSLIEPTRRAAEKLKHARFIERPDISKPAFEQPAMAELLRSIFLDNSQTPLR